MINGEDKCKEEATDFLQICPNFVLDDMRKKKLEKMLHRNIQLNEYSEAMEVASYNKGRTISQLDGSKTYESGTRKNLRPDTMWADERYANVTFEEIEETRKRIDPKFYDVTDKKIFKMKEQSQEYTDVSYPKALFI